MLPADLLALRISDRRDVKMDAGAEAGLSLVHISQDGRSVRPLWRQAASAASSRQLITQSSTQQLLY